MADLGAAGDWMEVSLAGGRTAFSPGETLEGTASWRLAERPRSLELHLFWYTRGKGDRDLELVETQPIQPPEPNGRCDFRFRLPAGPYSFSGKLVSLLWAVELVAEPGAKGARTEITVAPGGREVLLSAG
jgi:hypothetical protein